MVLIGPGGGVSRRRLLGRLVGFHTCIVFSGFHAFHLDFHCDQFVGRLGFCRRRLSGLWNHLASCSVSCLMYRVLFFSHLCLFKGVCLAMVTIEIGWRPRYSLSMILTVGEYLDIRLTIDRGIQKENMEKIDEVDRDGEEV